MGCASVQAEAEETTLSARARVSDNEDETLVNPCKQDHRELRSPLSLLLVRSSKRSQAARTCCSGRSSGCSSSARYAKACSRTRLQPDMQQCRQWSTTVTTKVCGRRYGGMRGLTFGSHGAEEGAE